MIFYNSFLYLLKSTSPGPRQAQTPRPQARSEFKSTQPIYPCCCCLPMFPYILQLSLRRDGAAGRISRTLSSPSYPALRSVVVVVYQFSISNVMYTGDVEALFVFGSRCFILLETHPLLRGTYPIITSPGQDWQVHTHCGIPHINASLLYSQSAILLYLFFPQSTLNAVLNISVCP